MSIFRIFSQKRLLRDDFSIQDIPQQQIHCSRFRAIKATLLRCMKDDAGQAVDCYIRQLLLTPIKEVANGCHVDVFINYSTVSTYHLLPAIQY